jgi:hypothetical protein
LVVFADVGNATRRQIVPEERAPADGSLREVLEVGQGFWFLISA